MLPTLILLKSAYIEIIQILLLNIPDFLAPTPPLATVETMATTTSWSRLKSEENTKTMQLSGINVTPPATFS